MGWAAYPGDVAMRRQYHGWYRYDKAHGHEEQILHTLVRGERGTYMRSSFHGLIIANYGLFPSASVEFDLRLPYVDWPGLTPGLRRFRVYGLWYEYGTATDVVRSNVDSLGLRSPSDGRWRYQHFQTRVPASGRLLWDGLNAGAMKVGTIPAATGQYGWWAWLSSLEVET